MKYTRTARRFAFIFMALFIVLMLAAMSSYGYALARVVDIAEQMNPIVKQVLDSIDKWSIPDVALAIRLGMVFEYAALASLFIGLGFAIYYIAAVSIDTVTLLVRKKRDVQRSFA